MIAVLIAGAVGMLVSLAGTRALISFFNDSERVSQFSVQKTMVQRIRWQNRERQQWVASPF